MPQRQRCKKLFFFPFAIPDVDTYKLDEVAFSTCSSRPLLEAKNHDMVIVRAQAGRYFEVVGEEDEAPDDRYNRFVVSVG